MPDAAQKSTRALSAFRGCRLELDPRAAISTRPVGGVDSARRHSYRHDAAAPGKSPSTTDSPSTGRALTCLGSLGGILRDFLGGPAQTLSWMATRSGANFLPQLRHATRFEVSANSGIAK